MTETNSYSTYGTETERGDVHCIHLPQYTGLCNVTVETVLILWGS